MVGGRLTRQRGCTSLAGRVSHDILRVSPAAGAAAQSATRGSRPFCTQRASRLRWTRALGHPPPTMAGTADKSSPRGPGPRVLVHPRSLPLPPPTFTAQRCLLSSAPSPSGALNPPLPSSRGGGLSPRGRKQAGSSPGCQGRFSLHSTGTPSSSLLGPGARAGTPESQSPNPSARTSQALDGARATGGRQKS